MNVLDHFRVNGPWKYQLSEIYFPPKLDAEIKRLAQLIVVFVFLGETLMQNHGKATKGKVRAMTNQTIGQLNRLPFSVDRTAAAVLSTPLTPLTLTFTLLRMFALLSPSAKQKEMFFTMSFGSRFQTNSQQSVYRSLT